MTRTLALTLVLTLLAAGVSTALAPAAEPAGQTMPAGQVVVEKLQQEAAAIEPLVTTPLVKDFLSSTRYLPTVETRTVWPNREKGIALSAAQYDALPEADREGFTARECTPAFYYYTGYGTPLVYARPLDIAFAALGREPRFDGDAMKVLDFGYGTIGHLRLLANRGIHAHGVEIEPLFQALYSEPGDTGTITQIVNAWPTGSITLHTGRFPADEALTGKIRDAGPYDLFISKNTLKRGYIHPERECDPKLLVHLGVDDEAFVRAMHDNLKPGGIALIYNISPAPAPDDKPYIPWADGRCPFDRELLEQVGFEVLAFDQDDNQMLHQFWTALGLSGEQSADDLKSSIFATYTLLKRKAD